MGQEAVNEIHGALHAPDNPVVPMSGSLRTDLLDDLVECEEAADLVLAVGTSLAGMNADRLVQTAVERARCAGDAGGHLGAVLVGLQRTTYDRHLTLRIFATCDETFRMLAEEMGLSSLVPPARAPGSFFVPPVLQQDSPTDGGVAGEAYLLPRVGYDAMGRRSGGVCTALDLRDGASLVIPSGPHAGARGEVDGCDREGHPRIRFMLRLKKGGSTKVPSMMVLGTWWLQAAADSAVKQLPAVNLPDEGDTSPAATELRALLEAYA
jgi:hypothetical protein